MKKTSKIVQAQLNNVSHPVNVSLRAVRRWLGEKNARWQDKKVDRAAGTHTGLPDSSTFSNQKSEFG
jgi:hypothetical protein